MILLCMLFYVTEKLLINVVERTSVKHQLRYNIFFIDL